MSERLLFKGQLLDDSPLKVDGFDVQTFGVKESQAPPSFVPKTATFEDFSKPKARPAAKDAPKGEHNDAAKPGQHGADFNQSQEGKPKSPKNTFEKSQITNNSSGSEVDLGGPSLGYLFRPFDPGKIETKQEYKEMERPAPEADFAYKDLDLRDANIINTLDRANKKAKEIVFTAFDQGRRLKDQMIEATKADCADLSKELMDKVNQEAEEERAKAKSQAEAIISEAKAKAATIDSERQALEASQKENLAKQAELTAQSQELENLRNSLNNQKAQLDKLEAELLNKRTELEAKFKEESQAVLAQMTEKGQAEGLKKGLSEGLEIGRSEVLKKAEGFFAAASKIGGIWHQLWQKKAPFMVTLAVEAAQAIVNKEIENGRGLAAGAFEACVEYLQKAHRAVFRLRPEDLAEVEAARLKLRDKLDGLVNIEFVPDEALGPGDLVMESDAGRLDATIKNRRERIMGALKEALDRGLIAELPNESPEAAGQAQVKNAAAEPKESMPPAATEAAAAPVAPVATEVTAAAETPAVSLPDLPKAPIANEAGNIDNINNPDNPIAPKVPTPPEAAT
ncbi:MAG: hypothetical protein LBE31_11745 [Deltaproteobacteria bacterium]|nr:hypothetical protein [Deltaproteobacteria bacterium]